MPFHHWVAQGL